MLFSLFLVVDWENENAKPNLLRGGAASETVPRFPPETQAGGEDAHGIERHYREHQHPDHPLHRRGHAHHLGQFAVTRGLKPRSNPNAPKQNTLSQSNPKALQPPNTESKSKGPGCTAAAPTSQASPGARSSRSRVKVGVAGPNI